MLSLNMPNYITTTCRVVGPAEAIQRFKEAVFIIAPEGHSDAGGTLFDFNGIIQMPQSIADTVSGSAAEEGLALIIARGSNPAPFADLGLYAHRIQHIRREAGLAPDAAIKDVAAAYLTKWPLVEAAGRAQLIALAETGSTDWYSWSTTHWGTKWGSFRFAVRECSQGYAFAFETAWSFPTPKFQKLAVDFPDLQFECHTSDEGRNFAGSGWFNAHEGQADFKLCDATDELYQIVYGRAPENEEEDEEPAA
jgi:hypothetical protein